MADLLKEIEEQIAGAKAAGTRQNVGVIREIGDGIARVEGLDDAMLNEMLDLDLHHNIPGATLFVGRELDHDNGLLHAPMDFDPAVLGSGRHKIAIRRTQTNGPELSAVLLVTYVTVDGNAPATSPPPASPVVGAPAPAPVVGAPVAAPGLDPATESDPMPPGHRLPR